MKDLLQIKGRRYLVTGAASGIGRATSLLLSEMGAKVLLVDINEENLIAVQKECEGETDILVLDLTDANIINKNSNKLSFGKWFSFIMQYPTNKESYLPHSFSAYA